MRRSLVVLSALVVSLAGLPVHAGSPAVSSAVSPAAWDQSHFSPAGSIGLSSYVSADDFVLAGDTYLTHAAVWLSDGTANDNGVLDTFSGTISWAIYADGTGLPGSLRRSGRGVAVNQRDTGRQDVLGDDILQVDFDLEPPVFLEAGTYWLALHEGAWGSASDGTEIWWEVASSANGDPPAFAGDETNPGAWMAWSFDTAFVLYGVPPAWYQFDSGTPTNNNGNLFSYELAGDFLLDGSRTFGAADVWIADGTANDNGVLDTFSGTLGWGFYADSNGLPGSLLASGEDVAPTVVDTGAQDPYDEDVARVRLRFGGAPLDGTGGFWFALHAGDWGQAADGSVIWWQLSSSVVGPGLAETIPPFSGDWQIAEYDTSFVLFDEAIFGSGFEAGVTCAWSNGVDVDCPEPVIFAPSGAPRARGAAAE